MTGRERFRATVKCEKIDRFFRHDEGAWPSTIEKWLKEGLPADWEEKNFFEMDKFVSMATGIDLGWCHPAFYPPLEKKIITREGNTNIVRDADGIIKRELAQRPDLSMPQFLEFPVKNRQDWGKIKLQLDPGSEGRYEHVEESVKNHGDPRRDYPIWQGTEGAYMRIRNMLGEVNLAYAFYDAPDLIHDILDNWTAINCEAFRRIAGKIDLDKVELAEDMCYKKGPLLSPNHIREFLAPHYRTLFAEIRRCCPNIVIGMDTDGNVEQLIPIIKEIGIEMLCPMEVAAGNSVIEYRKKYPDLIISGGIDKRALAAGKDEISRELERVLPAMWRERGYIPTVDHTVPPNVSLENFIFYLKEVRSFR